MKRKFESIEEEVETMSKEVKKEKINKRKSIFHIDKQLIIYFLFIGYFFLPYIYSKLLMMVQHYPTFDYNWNCNQYMLNVPIYDEYFNSNYKINYIKCENNNTVVYKDLETLKRYYSNNYDEFLSEVIQNNKNNTKRRQILYVPNNPDLNIDINVYTHHHIIYYFTLELNCNKISEYKSLLNNTIDIPNLGVSRTIEYFGKPLIKEFLNNCTYVYN